MWKTNYKTSCMCTFKDFLFPQYIFCKYRDMLLALTPFVMVFAFLLRGVPRCGRWAFSCGGGGLERTGLRADMPRPKPPFASYCALTSSGWPIDIQAGVIEEGKWQGLLEEFCGWRTAFHSAMCFVQHTHLDIVVHALYALQETVSDRTGSWQCSACCKCCGGQIVQYIWIWANFPPYIYIYGSICTSTSHTIWNNSSTDLCM